MKNRTQQVFCLFKSINTDSNKRIYRFIDVQNRRLKKAKRCVPPLEFEICYEFEYIDDDELIIDQALKQLTDEGIEKCNRNTATVDDNFDMLAFVKNITKTKTPFIKIGQAMNIQYTE